MIAKFARLEVDVLRNLVNQTFYEFILLWKGVKHKRIKWCKNHARPRIFSSKDEKDKKISIDYLI
jgi:hypothetical protein